MLYTRQDDSNASTLRTYEVLVQSVPLPATILQTPRNRSVTSTTWVSSIFTVERRHRRKCFGGNNANCLVCNRAVLGGMCVNRLRWACPKTWTPIYDNAVTFGESVTALCLPPCPPDFEYKQITSCGFCQLSRESDGNTCLG